MHQWATFFCSFFLIFITFQTSKFSVVLRYLGYSFGPAFSAAFFLVVLFSDINASKIDVFSSFIFEFFILVVTFHTFNTIRKYLNNYNVENCRREVKFFTLLLIFITITLFFESGFGLFSDGSRIEFLGNGAIVKYQVYIGMLLQAIIGVIIAACINSGDKLSSWVYVSVVYISFLSIASGSKGGLILWIVSILCLLNDSIYKKRKKFILSVFLFLLCAVFLTVFFVSNFLGLDTLEFLSLSLQRFFLVNDGRALAFDLRSLINSPFDFWKESFRVIFNAIGYQSNYPVLGFRLYSEYFGSSGVGANSSLTALAVAFSYEGFSGIPIFFIFLLACLAYFMFSWISTFVQRGLPYLYIKVITLIFFLIMSQDFLALPLLIPGIAGVICIVFMKYGVRKKN